MDNLTQYEMVCPSKKCGYRFTLRKGEKYAAPCECYKCGNIMTRKMIDFEKNLR